MPRKQRPHDQVVSIYRLLDPRDGEPRYVGQSNNPEVRVGGHLTDARFVLGAREVSPGYPSNKKKDWLIELIGLGLVPKVEVVALVPSYHARHVEQACIQQSISEGAQLVNTYIRPTLL